jgi:uncharacterized membrane protein YeaQ/YmgE (transglycosylase-associated protein family)
MDLLQILILLVIAGFLMSVIVGVVGAYLGTTFADMLPIPSLLPISVGTYHFDLVWAVVGSLLLLLLLELVRYGSAARLFARR